LFVLNFEKNMRLPFLLSLLGFGILAHGQNYPSPPSRELYANEISATMSVLGSQFYDYSGPGFFFPGHVLGPKDTRLKTIFSQGLWLTGRQADGDLVGSVVTYGSDGLDYTDGPILAHPEYLPWRRVFMVEDTDIYALLEDWADNGQIDQSPAPALLEWPGKGNPWFKAATGIDLPDGDMAPFFDRNGDGVYDPWQGDYPVVRSDCEAFIPGVIGWTIFNDLPTLGKSGTAGYASLNVQVRTTMFAFRMMGVESLDRTIFLKYEITSFNPQTIEEFRVGQWVDFDIGCYIDDYVGCDPPSNTFYGYNDNDLDFLQCSQGVRSYGWFPPVQTVTLLDKPLGSCIAARFSAVSEPGGGSNYNRHNLNKGVWSDGTPITYGGTGYLSGGEVTSFLFSDRPSDPAGWSEWTANSDSGDRRFLGSTAAEVLAPGETFTMYTAYTTHWKDSLTVPEMVDMALDLVPEVQTFFDNCFTWPGVVFDPCKTDCVWPGDLDNNGMVNNLDMLSFGVRMGAEGPARDYPFAGWTGQDAEEWPIMDVLPSNPRHTDADGNGLIDFQDVQVVLYNQYKVRPGFVEWGGSNDIGPELSVQRMFGPWASPDTVLSPGGRLQVQVRFENQASQPIYGIGFSMTYDTNVLAYFGDPSKLTMNHNVGFFQASAFHGNFHRPDGWDFYATRVNGLPVSLDIWNMLQLRFVVRNDVVLPPEPITALRLHNYVHLLADGSSVPIGAQGLNVQYGPITSTENPTLQAGWNIWPNPGRDEVFIATAGALSSVRLMDALGRILAEQRPLGQYQSSIHTGGLPPGMYLVELEFINGERKVLKWVKALE